MANPPPSLRLYGLARKLPGLFSGTDLLEGDGLLLLELEAYAAEEARVQSEEAARARHQNRHAAASGPRVAGSRRPGR